MVQRASACPGAVTGADHARFLSQVEALGGEWVGNAAHTGWCTHPVLRRTSYAKEAEPVRVTPFTQINVFPTRRMDVGRSAAAVSGAAALRGGAPAGPHTPTRSRLSMMREYRAACDTTPPTSFCSPRPAAPAAPSPSRSLAPTAASPMWYDPGPRGRGPARGAAARGGAEDRRVLRGIASGRVATPAHLPVPALFAYSP